MVLSRRWWAVLAAAAVVIGGPQIARGIPPDAPDLSAASVFDQIQGSAQYGYSGTVELTGNIKLPVTSRFTDLGPLLGDRTTLRVWWRSASDWRVDKQLIAGETDLYHSGDSTTEWKYEAAQATRSVDPKVRLPRTADLLPPTLAARLLGDRDAITVQKVAARRVAGHTAVGIRVRPNSSKSSIDHIDLWADPNRGLVLRLEVYATDSSTPSFTTSFTSYTPRSPPESATRFLPPASVQVRYERVLDIADAANIYAPLVPPEVVAGEPRTDTREGAVGTYGRGPTQFLAIPLRGRDAGTLRDQVNKSPNVTRTAAGPSLTVGPLSILVTEGRGRDWLIVGAVTAQTLVAAAADLRDGTRYLDR